MPTRDIMIVLLSALILGGCATVSIKGDFRLSKRQLSAAWSRTQAEAQAQPQPEGTDILWNHPPRFSDASCVWVKVKQEAECHYLEYASQGAGQIARETILVLSEDGWKFGS